MDKSLLRKEMLIKRAGLSDNDWFEKSSIIQKIILQSKLLDIADDILVYADYKGEVETKSIIEDALLEGKNVYLPRVCESDSEPLMEFYKISSINSLSEGYKGIREPIPSMDCRYQYDEKSGRCTIMFVPGVAFDKYNNRLGYGKGFYDYYLKDKKQIITVGLGFSLQIVDELPVSDNDVTLNMIVTEDSSVNEINKLLI